jgi:superfamily II DNA/RNA helicase
MEQEKKKKESLVTITPLDPNSRGAKELFSGIRFDSLPIVDRIAKSLEENLGVTIATKIQKGCFQPLLDGKDL